MLEVISKAVVLVLIIAVGYFLKRTKLLGDDAFPMLSTIVMKVTLPCVIITSLSGATFSASLFSIIALGFLCNVFTICVGYVMNLKGSGTDRAFGMINLSGFNIGCCVLPFVQAFFGTTAMTTLFLFDAGNSVMCTGGTLAVASSVAGYRKTFRIGEFLKKLFTSVPLDTYIIMFAVTMAGITLPSGILTFAETVGRANSFLAMLMIGVGLEIPKSLSHIKLLTKMLSVRTALCFAMAAVFMFLLPFEYEVRCALVLLAFSPVSTLCPVFTSETGGDTALSADIASVTIILGIIFITIGIFIL